MSLLDMRRLAIADDTGEKRVAWLRNANIPADTSDEKTAFIK